MQTKRANDVGSVTFTWQWAPGDEYGQYRVRATDLASGRSANATVTVQAAGVQELWTRQFGTSSYD